MSRDLKAFIISTLIMAGCIVVQSTLLDWISIRGVIPDLALIVLVFVAIRRGSLTAQLGGFVSGLVEDVLSLSPVGFHALFRTIVGFLCGLSAGNIFVDPILMPVILAVIGTILKGFLSSLLISVFSIPGVGFRIFSGSLWIELGYNAFLAPFLFALLGVIRPLRPREKERL